MSEAAHRAIRHVRIAPAASSDQFENRDQTMGISVGVVGLGIMGGAIIEHIARQGEAVYGYDIDEQAKDRARRAGVHVTADIRTLAKRCAIVMTSLPSFAAATSVMDDIVAAAEPGCIIAELSTFSLDQKLALRDKATSAGHMMIDCPLSGTGAQAKTGDVVVYASGEKAAIERCEPIFAKFSRSCFNLGAFGNGSRLKFIANHLVAIHNVASAEAMVLAMKAGLDPKQVVEVIRAGAGSSRTFEMRAPLMAENRYEPPTMQLDTWFKDMDIIDAFARGMKTPTPLFDSTKAIYAAASSMGYGAVDTASVCAVLEQMAGLVRSPPLDRTPGDTADVA
jgi:L-threonate 2-dehydrogenase